MRQARHCVAKKSNGEPCKKYAIQGATVCDSHGGATGHIKAKAAVRAELMHWGLGDANIDPGETLLRLLSQSAVRADRYALELEEHCAESPTLRAALVAKAYGEFGATGEYVRALATLEAQERDRCANMAIKAIAAGLAERTVRIAEQNANIAQRALMAALDDIGLTSDQRNAASARLVHHLRLVG